MEHFSSFHFLLQHPWQGTVVSYIPVFPIVTPAWIDEVMGGGRHAFSRAMPGFLHEQWPLIDRRTMIDPFRLGRLLDLLVQVKDLPGEVVECGSWKGGSGILMALALKQLGIPKQVHLFDSFEGLPAPDGERDQGYSEGMFRSDHGELSQYLRELKLDDRITLHKGWFDRSIPAYRSGNPPGIALLHIDCDLYRSTLTCLEGLYPLVVPGGAVVLDDYNDGCGGEQQAVKAYFPEEKICLQVGPAPQVCFFKGQESRGSDQQVYVEGNMSYSFEALLEDAEYLRWVEKQLGYDYGGKLEAGDWKLEIS